MKLIDVIADNRIIKEEINKMKSIIIQINNTLRNDLKLEEEKLLDHLGFKYCDLSLIETAHINRKFNFYTFYIPHEQKSIVYKYENWPVGVIIKKFTDYKPFDSIGLYETVRAYNNHRLHNSTPSADS
jgi:hypothetical protein